MNRWGPFYERGTMETKRSTGVAILIFVFIIGCLGTYGKIRKQAGSGERITVAKLKDNWGEYDIYYAMRSNRYADAIMFDPKDSGTKLEGDSWIKIENQETLNEKITEVQTTYDYARVYIIEGIDNQIFGYMYYPSYLQLPVKVVDERTLYVSALPMYKSTPGR